MDGPPIQSTDKRLTPVDGCIEFKLTLPAKTLTVWEFESDLALAFHLKALAIIDNRVILSASPLWK